MCHPLVRSARSCRCTKREHRADRAASRGVRSQLRANLLNALSSDAGSGSWGANRRGRGHTIKQFPGCTARRGRRSRNGGGTGALALITSGEQRFWSRTVERTRGTCGTATSREPRRPVFICVAGIELARGVHLWQSGIHRLERLDVPLCRDRTGRRANRQSGHRRTVTLVARG